MGYWKAGNKEVVSMDEFKDSKVKETVEEILEYPIKGYKQRGIYKRTMEKFGVRCAVSEEDGETPVAFYFPSYNQKGKIVGFKKMDLTKSKEEKGYWTTIGSVTISNKMFGQDVAEKNQRKRNNLVITEGECLLPTTKVLVENVGWVSLEEYTHGRVMQGDGTFAEPIAKVYKDYEGTMIRYLSGSYTLDMTPEHNMLRIDKKLGLIKTKAGDLTQKHKPIPRTVNFESNADNLLARLQVMFSADFTFRATGDIYGTLKKQRKIERAKMLLDQSGVSYSVNLDSRGYASFFIHRGHNLPVSKLFDYERDLKNAKTIIEEVVFWDGNEVTKRNQIEYSTVIEHNAKFIQTCAHLCGYVSSIIYRKRDQYSWMKVSILFGKTTSSTQKGFSEYEYSGKVACLTMPDGTLLVKQGDSISVTGNCDTLSAYQACVEDVVGTKFEGLEPFIVSIPMGTANAVESAMQNENFIRSFDALTIFFDDDHATPSEKKKGIMKGHEARDAIANAFIDSGLSLMTILADGEFKDASDYLQAGKSTELAQLISFGKRVFSAEKIVRASDISFEELIAPRPEGVYVHCFPKLMEKIHGFRLRELVLLTSPSGVGKSTVTSIFADAFMQQTDEKVAMIYLEETNKETLQRMVASKLKVNYLKFKDKPLECGVTEEEIKAAYNEIANNDRLIMLGHFGSLPVSELMSKIKHMHFVEGCKYILLDHLSMVVSGSKVVDERKELDEVMTTLAAFCAANDVCIIAVSHINRSAAELFKPPKGKEDEPFWVRVTKEMMRGSAALEQLSFIILGLEPEILPDRSRGRVRLTVLKNRPWSYLGVADEFTVDENTWEVVISEDDEYAGEF